MDRVHGVVHGPGPQGWSMDPGPCFVYVLYFLLLFPSGVLKKYVSKKKKIIMSVVEFAT